MLVGIGPEKGPCWKPCWGASSCSMDEQRRGLSGGEGRGSRALGWVGGQGKIFSPLLSPLLLAPQQGRLLPLLPAPALAPGQALCSPAQKQQLAGKRCLLTFTEGMRVSPCQPESASLPFIMEMIISR